MAGLFSSGPASPGLNGAPQGLLDLLFPGSGIAQFADSRQNTLGAIGAGLARGTDLSSGLAQAAQAIPQARQQDYQQSLYRGQVSQTVQYLQAKHPDIAQAVAAGAFSPAEGYAEAWKLDHPTPVALAPGSSLVNPQTGQATYTSQTGNPEQMSVADRTALADANGIKGAERANFIMTGKIPNVLNRLSLNPTYLTDKSGKVQMGQASPQGTIVPTQLPEGMDLLDPRQLAGMRASGTAQGTISGNAAAGLPIAAQTADNALKTITALKSDTKGIDATFGHYGPFDILPSQWGITVPGSDKANYQAVLDQAKGQAFLAAYQQLRGGGAISDVEGQKAGNALARINDPNIGKDAYLKALDDFESVIKTGYDRIKQQAAGAGMAPEAMPQLQQDQNQQYVYNPDTGQLE